jgi:signal transduction histidine kinase
MPSNPQSEAKLLLQSERSGNEILVSLYYDTGKCIDADILPQLFTKFATKSYTGTGLGLFISKNIVEAHDGKIWAENHADDKGAFKSLRNYYCV